MNLTCPGCGFCTIGESTYGSYEICPACGWEDDAVQLANPCSGGGANRESLCECQLAVEAWPKEKKPAFERDPDWRPLGKEEVVYFLSAAQIQHWAFMGETAPELVYWRKSPLLKKP